MREIFTRYHWGCLHFSGSVYCPVDFQDGRLLQPASLTTCIATHTKYKSGGRESRARTAKLKARAEVELEAGRDSNECSGAQNTIKVENQAGQDGTPSQAASQGR